MTMLLKLKTIFFVLLLSIPIIGKSEKDSVVENRNLDEYGWIMVTSVEEEPEEPEELLE